MRLIGLIALFLCSCTQIKKVEVARITAYHSKESDHLKYKNKNAAGGTLVAGRSIAADWSIWPLGTEIKINNHIYVVDDYGSYILKCKMPTIDLYVRNKKEMNEWGAKVCNIEVVKMGDFQASANILKDRLKYRHCREMMLCIINKHPELKCYYLN